MVKPKPEATESKCRPSAQRIAGAEPPWKRKQREDRQRRKRTRKRVITIQEHEKEEMFKDEIRANAFALAHSLALLPEFSLPRKVADDIDSVAVDELHYGDSQEDVNAFTSCVKSFFLKQPELQSAASTTDIVPAHTLKPTEELRTAWTEILTRRRMVEDDDAASINDDILLQKMYGNWSREFSNNKLIADELTADGYHKKKYLTKPMLENLFAIYLKNTFGGEDFVMALWQTGISWAATELEAVNCVQWVQRVIIAQAQQRENRLKRRRSQSYRACASPPGLEHVLVV